MRIYITHCSRKKDNSLQGTNIEVPPDKLYTSKHIQCFMCKCKKKEVNWAIFSDEYGVWFPWIKHKWYDKPPSKVTPAEFVRLLSDFDQKLQGYDEIWFYRQPGGRPLHPLYQELLQRTRLKNKVKKFKHIEEIV